MIRGEIRKYHKILSELNAAIHDDDDNKIVALDREIDAVWQHILSFEPRNDADLILLVEFLMEIILPANEQDSTRVAAADRVKFLVGKIAADQESTVKCKDL